MLVPINVIFRRFFGLLVLEPFFYDQLGQCQRYRFPQILLSSTILVDIEVDKYHHEAIPSHVPLSQLSAVIGGSPWGGPLIFGRYDVDFPEFP